MFGVSPASSVFVAVPLYICDPDPCVHVGWLFRSMIVLSVCMVVFHVRWMSVLFVAVAMRLFGGWGM